MTRSEPEEPSFKITDRRRRFEDDEPSSSATKAEPPSPDPELAKGASPRRSENDSLGRSGGDPVGRPESARQAPASPEPAPGDAGPERDLTGLFVMLGTSAALALGEAADPVTGEVHHDPGQAAELIDLLALLRRKTEGNRTPSETQVLDDVLYDLQLRYVSATKRGGPGRGPSRS
jgi:uncharacterized protein DUF1844